MCCSRLTAALCSTLAILALWMRMIEVGAPSTLFRETQLVRGRAFYLNRGSLSQEPPPIPLSVHHPCVKDKEFPGRKGHCGQSVHPLGQAAPFSSPVPKLSFLTSCLKGSRALPGQLLLTWSRLMLCAEYKVRFLFTREE